MSDAESHVEDMERLTKNVAKNAEVMAKAFVKVYMLNHRLIFFLDRYIQERSDKSMAIGKRELIELMDDVMRSMDEIRGIIKEAK